MVAHWSHAVQQQDMTQKSISDRSSLRGSMFWAHSRNQSGDGGWFVLDGQR